MRHRLGFVLFVGALSVLLAATLNNSVAESTEVTPLPPVQKTDRRGGVCFSYYPGDPDRPYLPLAREAGSRWDRFDFIWPTIEQTKDNWQFAAYDDLVQDMSEVGMNVVGILLWTPEWAATGDRRARSLSEPPGPPSDWYAPSIWSTLSAQAPPRMSASPPEGLYEAWDDWTTSDGDPVNYWGRYVHTIVSRYSNPSRFAKPVKHWEVWNEVDDGAWDYFWTGSKADYAQLLKVGYQATKAACPDCTVLYAGLLYWADQHYFEDVLDILNDDPSAAANNYYFDAMSVHLYSRSSSTYDTVNHIRSRMKEYVPDRPIWLTETGVPVWDDALVNPHPDPYPFAATQEEAAAYVIQSYANALASGVERYFFFRANDQDMSEYFGLMRNDQTFRPSYVAYQLATSHLVSPTMVTNWTYSQEGVRRVTLWGTPRGKISVLWNTRPVSTTFDYHPTLSTATLVDPRGSAHTITPTASGYAIALPGATAKLEANQPNELPDYYIGGEPFLVIEEDTMPPSVATVDPLPATTYSYTIPVSWSATDDRAGIWGFDVQVQQGGEGRWNDWLKLKHTIGITSAAYDSGEHDTSYCFRARAWDKAGNLGPWSTNERCTRLNLEQDVQLRVEAVFGDENGDGVWDAVNSEVALENLTFRLVDEHRADVVTPSQGQSLQITKTLRLGKYAILIKPDGWPSPPGGWLPRQLPIIVTGGEEPLIIRQESVGLLRHRSSSYLPLVAYRES